MRWLLLIIALVAGLLVVAAFVGLDPKDRRPGAWLSGQPVTELPDDWSFTDDFQEVWIETRPWYGIPFSVTTVIASDGDGVVVPSIYADPGPFPGTKYWNRIVASNPAVRLQVGERIYPMHIEPIQDQAAFDHAFGLLADKYPFWDNARRNPSERPPMALLRLRPRAAD